MQHDPRFENLRQSADRGVAPAIEEFVYSAPETELCRINVVDFAEKQHLAPEAVLDAFVHASKLGIFEMSWNILCPGCGGVLDATASPKSIHKEEYTCALCAAGYQPTLDEMVEVSFTISPSVRRIAAHDPSSLPLWQYYRLMYFSNGLRLPPAPEFEAFVAPFAIEAEEIPPHGKVVLSTHLPAQFVILFEPVTHSATFLDVKGEPVTQRRDLSVAFDASGAPTRVCEMQPGPLRLVLENRTDQRLLPALLIAGDALHDMLLNRRSFLTAKRLFTNQTFRDLYRADTLNIDQRLKISSLTVLFTDLKGSTELYERVGDLVAYDLVRDHFRVLGEVVRAESGAVVKTIGDAVMATFPTAGCGLSAALKMRDAMDQLNASTRHEDLIVKIGLHEGPCLAVMSNERLDYFGQTVNIAARVQALATSRSIFVTEPVITSPTSSELIQQRSLHPTSHRALLRGIGEELTVYEIP
jgi:class 3 adenylate cyclase